MPKETCILTTKDYTIIEVMYDRSCRHDDPLTRMLRRKLDTARVVFSDDVPADVATLGSRTTFSIDGRDTDTRVISHDHMASPVGMFLPITTPRGLALLGLAEGQTFALDGDGNSRVVLERVHFQPEAVRREREAAAPPAEPMAQRPKLTLIRGGSAQTQAALKPDFDDPGPSAA